MFNDNVIRKCITNSFNVIVYTILNLRITFMYNITVKHIH